MKPMLRIGHGYDVHAFEKGNELILAGVTIPFDKQFKAHSDGDVLLHALCDALLGALALGDIGQHFPDTDPQYKGISSRALLEAVYQKVNSKHYLIANLDITVLAEKPRLSDYIEAMCANIAKDLKLDIDSVNVKATTTEGLGFVGEQQGIACHAVVLLVKESARAQ